MADRYWNPAGSANWNDPNVWALTDGGDPTGISTPNNTNDVYFTSTNNNNCTLTANAECNNIKFTDGALTTGYSGNFNFNTKTLSPFGDSVIFSSNMTRTGTGSLTLLKASGTVTLNTNNNISLPSCIVGSGLTLSLASNLTVSSGSFGLIGAGGIITNGYDLDLASLVANTNNVRNIDISNSEIIIRTNGILLISYGNLTLTSTGSLIRFVGTPLSDIPFYGAGMTWNDLSIETSGIRFVSIMDSNNINNIYISAGSKVKFNSNKTQTLNNPPQWIGTSLNPITINSSTSSSAGIISCPSGTSSCEYLVLKDNTATGGATFNVLNGTNSGNVTGWNFLTGFKPKIIIM